MAALGPLVGGWFVTHMSWRWAFYVNLPIALLALVGAFLFVDESRDPGARPGYDPPGVVLSTLGFLGIVFGLIEGQTYGWWQAKREFIGLAPFGHSVIPFAFAVGVLALAGFVLVERSRARSGRPVLVDFALFRIPSFGYGNVAVLIVGLGELGLVQARCVHVSAATGSRAGEPPRRARRRGQRSTPRRDSRELARCSRDRAPHRRGRPPDRGP